MIRTSVFSVLVLALLPAFAADAPVPPGSHIMEIVVYPGRVVTAEAGKPFNLRYLAVLPRGQTTTNFTGYPATVRVREFGARITRNQFALAAGRLTLESDATGYVEVDLLSLLDGQERVLTTSVVNFVVPPFEEPRPLLLTPSTSQANIGDVLSVAVTMPATIEQPLKLVVYDSGLAANAAAGAVTIDLPAGVSAGQRITASAFQVGPADTAGDRFFWVGLFDREDNHLLSTDANVGIRRSSRPFVVAYNPQFAELTVRFPREIPGSASIVILGDEGLYLGFAESRGEVRHTETSEGAVLSVALASLASRIKLLSGYYSVAVVREGLNGSEGIVAPNALYFSEDVLGGVPNLK